MNKEQVDSLLVENKIIDGFPVPSYMRRAMMAQVKILEEVAAICKRHNIPYFAESGTLLGAVRHGGFIPWDDDLDIVMLRNDYLKFREIAKIELPEGYKVISIYDDEDYDNYLIRVVNSVGINYSDEFLEEYYGCPYSMGIDVFVYDKIAPTKELLEEQKNDCLRVNAFIKGVYDSKNAEKLLKELSAKYNYSQPMERSLMNRLYLMQDHIMAYYKDDPDATQIGLTPFWIENEPHICEEEYYKKVIDFKFENITVPIPLFYEEVLEKRYGQYMKLDRKSGLHEYPFFHEQVSILESRVGKPADEYQHTPSIDEQIGKNLVRPRNASKRRETIYKPYIDGIEQSFESIFNLLNSGNIDLALKVLTKSQELGIALGTLIEKIYGDSEANREKGSALAVKAVEGYCEAIYKLYDSIISGDEINENFSMLADAINAMIESINKNIVERKVIIILSYRLEDAKCYRMLESVENSQADIYKIATPFFERDMAGKIIEKVMCQSSDEFVSYNTVDIEKINPDKIYFNNPYDQYNSAVMVAPMYFSDRLVSYTDELIYIPVDEPAKLDEDDFRSFKNIVHFINKPGVINADKIYVKSGSIKTAYTRILMDWYGANDDKLADYFNNKIEVIEDNEPADKERKILYYIGPGKLCCKPLEAISKMRSNIEIFKSHRGNVLVTIVLEKNIYGIVEKYAREIYDDFISIISDCNSDDMFTVINKTDEFTVDKVSGTCDNHIAYYGDPSNMAAYMIASMKPVMLQSI